MGIKRQENASYKVKHKNPTILCSRCHKKKKGNFRYKLCERCREGMRIYYQNSKVNRERNKKMGRERRHKLKQKRLCGSCMKPEIYRGGYCKECYIEDLKRNRKWVQDNYEWTLRKNNSYYWHQQILTREEELFGTNKRYEVR